MYVLLEPMLQAPALLDPEVRALHVCVLLEPEVRALLGDIPGPRAGEAAASEAGPALGA